MLQGEHSAILSTFIKLPFVIKTVVLSIFEWPPKTGFIVQTIPPCLITEKKTGKLLLVDTPYGAVIVIFARALDILYSSEFHL